MALDGGGKSEQHHGATSVVTPGPKVVPQLWLLLLLGQKRCKIVYHALGQFDSFFGVGGFSCSASSILIETEHIQKQFVSML